jgi:hypothetical protein
MVALGGRRQCSPAVVLLALVGLPFLPAPAGAMLAMRGTPATGRAASPRHVMDESALRVPDRLAGTSARAPRWSRRARRRAGDWTSGLGGGRPDGAGGNGLPPDRDEFLRGFRAGTDRFMRLLIAAYEPVVCAVVRRAAPNDADVQDDLVQEVWISVWERRMQFSGEGGQSGTRSVRGFGSWPGQCVGGGAGRGGTRFPWTRSPT